MFWNSISIPARSLHTASGTPVPESSASTTDLDQVIQEIWIIMRNSTQKAIIDKNESNFHRRKSAH